MNNRRALGATRGSGSLRGILRGTKPNWKKSTIWLLDINWGGVLNGYLEILSNHKGEWATIRQQVGTWKYWGTLERCWRSTNGTGWELGVSLSPQWEALSGFQEYGMTEKIKGH